MAKLADRDCVPCRGGIPPLVAALVAPLLAQLDGWSDVDAHHIEKTYRFKDFARALEFVNRIGAIAEEQDHHPDLYLAWGKVRVKIWTHAVDGLTENDFILAAKCDVARVGMEP